MVVLNVTDHESVQSRVAKYTLDQSIIYSHYILYIIYNIYI